MNVGRPMATRRGEIGKQPYRRKLEAVWLKSKRP